MSLSAAVIRELVAAGLSGEALVAACERIEGNTPVDRTARQERNRRYYEANRLKASEKRLKTSYSDAKVSLSPTPPFPDKETSPTPPKEINPSPLTPQTLPKRSPLARTQSDEFAQFWSLFPNKVGKGDAVKAFAKARGRADFADIMAGLGRYAEKTDDRPWCNPSTFLNQDRWEDSPSAVQRQTTTGPPQKPSSINGEMIDLLNKWELKNEQSRYSQHDGQTIEGRAI